MIKHTPGPWRLDREVLEPDEAGGTGYVTHSVVAANGKMIASEELGMSFHDGCLIAAAPEMLEALKAIAGFEEYTSAMECGVFKEHRTAGGQRKQMQALARAAIAKAEGK